MSYIVNILYCLAVLNTLCQSKTHKFNFNVSWVDTNPDGTFPKKQIGVNGQWPPPAIHVNKNDRVEIEVTNSLSQLDNPNQVDNLNTTLHFHGFFHNITVPEWEQSNQNDGPEMVTGYGIPYQETLLYNFTVGNQTGTYWYHSHSGAQYIDGLRNSFIVHDVEKEQNEWKVDYDNTITISELYHRNYYQVMDKFLSRFNPTGAEPIPDSFLFNDSVNGTIPLEFDSRHLLRFINIGGFVSQFIYSPRIKFTVVEVDGVYVEPFETNLFEIGTGQRISVLVDTYTEGEFKKINHPYYGKQFPIYQVVVKSMLDVIPEGLELVKKHVFLYPGQELPSKVLDPEETLDSDDLVFDDFNIVPLGKIEAFGKPDRQIELAVKMENLGDGVNYAFFNNITYTVPKIPTLYSVYSAPKELLFDERIYGDNINAYVLKKNDVVEIVLNNDDDNKHNFHLHGHNFQIIKKGEADAGHYDSEISFLSDSSSENKYPMIRDTVFVESQSYIVLRFKADNPGVWFFHCHIDFHLEQGLAAVFIEAPDVIQEIETKGISESMQKIINKYDLQYKGNAAANSEDWIDLRNSNVQEKPLPNGFTLKGYIALLISSVVAIYGIYTIVQFGLDVDTADSEAEIIKNTNLLNKLQELIKDNE
ncbi:hypothetical protein ACO0SA_001045 [Hanseniaspora valbyensis]